MSGSCESVIFWLPQVATVGHLERIENCLPHPRIEREAGDFLDGALQIDEAFARVAESVAGLEVDHKRLAIGPLIGKAGTMCQDMPSGDGVYAVIVLYVLGNVFG